MTEHEEKLQWVVSASTWHGRGFGHKLRVATHSQDRDPVEIGIWTWKGIGVPQEIFKEVQGCLAATLADHLLFRYGVAEEFDYRSGGDGPAF